MTSSLVPRQLRLATDLVQASAIMSRLDFLLIDIAYRSYDAYFTQGLRSQIAGVQTECHPTVPSPSNRLPAYQMLQELSPFIKFTHFTAKQAILEKPPWMIWTSMLSTSTSAMDSSGRHSCQTLPATEASLSTLRQSRCAPAPTPAHNARQSSGRHSCQTLFAESLNLPYNSLSMYTARTYMIEFTKSCKGSVIVVCDTTNRPYMSLNKSQMLLVAV